MKLKKIQLSNNSLLNWLLQGKDNSFSLPFYTKDMLIDHLLESKNYYFENFKNNVENINFLEFCPSDYKKHEQILLMHNFLADKNELFSHFIIHGSYSDLRLIKGWSDFDAMAVIKKDALSRNNRLELLSACRELDTIMRKIDRYQHHGIQYIFEEELDSYPSLYLPKEIFSHAKCILNTKTIKIKHVESYEYEIQRLNTIYNLLIKSGSTGVFKHHQKSGFYLEENFKNTKTMYQLKYYLCVLMLLPTLWLNSAGLYCKKEESFEIIKKYFSEDDLEIITSASLIRSNWDQKKGNESEIDVIPKWVQNTLGKNYLIRGANLAKKFRRKDIKRL